MSKELKNFVVVGGGTAGWLTALMIKKDIPNINVTVVESEDIGIIGAGEGTTPHFIQALQYLDINITELFEHADATIKNAIKFTNWNGENDFYYHAFVSPDTSTVGLTVNPYRVFDKYNPYFNLYVEKNNNIEDLGLYSTLSEKNKTPLKYNGTESIAPIFKFALHFNAAKLANLLKDIGLKRGINSVVGNVISIKEDSGKISSLEIDNGSSLDLDFVFDCSGLNRLIIGKHFKSQWISHDKLPAKKAIPFFIDVKNGEKIPPYTESIAMKYGWMWKIPTQKRYGCGYVYDSDYITESEAVEEIESYLGFVPEYPRKEKGAFSFSAGFFEKTWVSNCVAVGLSSGFIEPLEATSIWLSIYTLSEILSDLTIFTSEDPRIVEDFNNKIIKFNESISAFIYLHYMTKREDTDFWKKFKDINESPEIVKNILNKWEYSNPQYSDFSDGIAFGYLSWVTIAAGTGNLNKDLICNSNKNNDISKKFELEYAYTKSNHSNDLELFMKHEDAIDYFGGKIEYK
jgi:tryptophan halogenase